MTESLLIEFLRKDGQPLQLIDLGLDYVGSLGLPVANANRPFRVEAAAKTSKKGNAYFDYSQARVPLPDGLDTRMRVGGVELVFGTVRESQKGNPLREGTTVVTLGEIPYDVTAYLTRTGESFWVKVHAHKATGRVREAPGAPISGGRIV